MAEKTQIKRPTPLFDNLEKIEEQLPPGNLSNYMKQDFIAAQNFLMQYNANEETLKAYRREIERLIQWSWLVTKKSILKLKREDIEEFIKFCQNS